MAGITVLRAAGGEGSRGARGFDATVAQSARVYDYWLGGKDNFEADRIAGEAAIDSYPAIRSSARANRAFLMRAVSYLARVEGIRQFLDVGAGLPTACNTHEVAQSVAPASRIVYVDNDPMVLSHARALLSRSPQGAIACVDADLRDTATILTQATEILDFTRPVAVMLLADVGRPRDLVGRFFDGLDLVEPGVVKVTRWHPRSELQAATKTSLWGGMARKPPRSGRD